MAAALPVSARPLGYYEPQVPQGYEAAPQRTFEQPVRQTSGGYDPAIRQASGAYDPAIRQASGAYDPAIRPASGGGVRLNIPWEQWSHEITPQRPVSRRQARAEASRYWYVPAPNGQVRRYASLSPQDSGYYEPQGTTYEPPYYNSAPSYQVPEPYGPQDRRGGLAPEFQKQLVNYSGREKPGTIVIDTNQKFLYLVQGDGTAIRYGIGVGKPGFEWSGVKTISRKAEWPDWTPPDEMIKRRPDLPRFMPGGPGNPLGARAMYLGSSLYRIHGTNEPNTIGHAVSSGCIRMVNEDVMDLYNRVRVGTKVIVI